MSQLAFQFRSLPLPVENKTISMIGARVEGGLSRAMHVQADDRVDYIAKAVGFGPRQSPFGPSNEMIAALIGRELRIPVNEFALLNHGEERMFGSRWLQHGSRSYLFHEHQLQKCRNYNDIYRIVPFDVYVCNTDRHAQNLVLRHLREVRKPDSYLLIANDHDRALLPEDLTPEDLADYWNCIAPQNFVKSAVLRQAIRDARLLDAGISAIEELTDDAVAGAVRTIPDGWLSRSHKRLVRAFLLERRTSVRGIIAQMTDIFPNLSNGVVE